MNKSLHYIGFGLLCFGFLSCVSIKRIESIYDDSKVLDLPAFISDIQINDFRTTVSPGEKIPLPAISHPNQYIKFHPALNSTHKELISNTILENTTGNTTTVLKVTIDILEAYQEFNATFTTETERAYVKLKIKIHDADMTYWSEQNAEFFTTTLDAKHKRIQLLFEETLKKVTHASLKHAYELRLENQKKLKENLKKTVIGQ